VHVMDTLEVGDRVAMSWDEYLSHRGQRRGEYYDDSFVVSPSAVQRHQRIVARLLGLIAPALPESADVLPDWGWRPWPSTEFIPDLVVFDRTDDRYLTSPPHLVVEVLSDDRGRDLLRKFHLYARAGAPCYWVIDPGGPTIVVYTLDGGAYRESARVAGDQRVLLDLGPASVEITPADLVR
jgi:Uma2 family endonuclease